MQRQAPSVERLFVSTLCVVRCVPCRASVRHPAGGGAEPPRFQVSESALLAGDIPVHTCPTAADLFLC